MSRLILALAAVAVVVAATGAQTANARTTCAEGGRVLTVWTTQNGDVATLRTTPQGLITGSARPGLPRSFGVTRLRGHLAQAAGARRRGIKECARVA
jgi:hypothetical protein